MHAIDHSTFTILIWQWTHSFWIQHGGGLFTTRLSRLFPYFPGHPRHFWNTEIFRGIAEEKEKETSRRSERWSKGEREKEGVYYKGEEDDDKEERLRTERRRKRKYEKRIRRRREFGGGGEEEGESRLPPFDSPPPLGLVVMFSITSTQSLILQYDKPLI